MANPGRNGFGIVGEEQMKILKVLFGILISVFFLWLVFRNIHIKKVWEVIIGANLLYIFVSIAIGLFAFAVRCYRWKIIGHEKYKDVPWISFFKSTNMGLMLNTFVPMRGGDLFQAYTLSRKENISKSYVFSTVVLERLIDIFPPVLIILISSVFIVLPKEITLMRLIVILAFLGISIAVAVRYGKHCIKIFDRFLAAHHSRKVQNFVDNFLVGLNLLKDKSVLLKVIPLTLVSWTFSGLSSYVVLNAVNIRLPFFAAFLVMAITIISVAIPSSPGYVGTWEFFCMLSLGIFGVEKTAALGFALLYHFLSLLPTTVFGLFYFIEDIISR